LVRGYEWDVQKLIYLKLVDSLTQPSKKIQRPRSEPIL
jgi:hypothetical protein